jgi:ATP-dependent Clp protease ATP-binding subunit ClpA
MLAYRYLTRRHRRKILGKKTTPSERELEKLRERRDVIYEKIALARTTLNQAHAARNDMLVSADLDDAAIERCDAACRAAQDHLDGLETAGAEIEARIGQMQAQIAEARDKAKREAAPAEINTKVDALTAALADFDRARDAVLAATKSVFARLPDTNPNFMPSVTGMLVDVSRELHGLADQVRAHAAAVMSGVKPVSVPQPELVIEKPRASCAAQERLPCRQWALDGGQ